MTRHTQRLIASIRALNSEQASLDARRAALDEDIGRHVATLRKGSYPRVTYAQIAKHIGSGVKYPWSLERGESRWSAETLRKVVEFLEHPRP